VAFSCQRLAAFPLAASSCGPYPEQAASLYVLPYEVGTGHEMVHSNCTTPGTSHQAGGTPVSFLNSSSHPNGLREGIVYVADPYPGCNCAP
jgi:hypothetical protein